MEIQNDAINQQIRTINERSKSSLAKNYNLQIISCNSRIQTPNPLTPLQKTVYYGTFLYMFQDWDTIKLMQFSLKISNRFPLNANTAEIGSSPL